MLKLRYVPLIAFWVLVFPLQSFAQDDIVKKGRALQREKKYYEALQLYRNALKKKPTEDLYIESVSLLGKLQKYNNAMIVLEKGIKDFPQSTSLKNLMALILIRMGEKGRAKAILEEVIAVDSNNSFALKWLEKLKNDLDTTMKSADKQTSSSALSLSTHDSAPKAKAFCVDNSLSEDQQRELAKKLYQEMMELDKWDLDSFKELHRKVIEKCPSTAQAEESCWRLSNLYLLGEDPSDFQSVIDVLEHLLKQYPDTPLLPDAKNRLLIAYQKTNQMDKVVAIYEELFTRDPDPPDDKIFMVRALEFADALSAIGRTAEAREWYQKILVRDGGRDLLEARVAKERLASENSGN